ncbi:MAG: hypothetical protein VB089_08435 [Anaerolineaceae bacterium]|nr:hypothetical protein [Anaerolineaceae bacterium]
MSTFRVPRRPAASLLTAAVLFLLPIAVRLVPGPRTVDDAYITFRYARNILNGSGFVYNPGEHVLGTTTPLYTGLMALLALPAGGPQAPFPLLALGVNALADAITCLLLWDMGRRLFAPRVGMAAALLWAVAPFSVTFAIGGLETSLYVCLLTGAAWAHMTGRRTLAAACAALAILTRPDALLLVGLLALDRAYLAWRRQEPLRLAELATFSLPLAAWGIFATLYYGSPLPHSVAAKLAVYHLSAGEALVRLLQHYATPFFEYELFGPAGTAVGLILYPFLFWIGARKARRAIPRLLPFILYPWVYLIIFSLANPLIFRWYLTPPLPAYFFFILLGADTLLRQVLPRLLPGAAGQTAVSLLVLIALPLGFSLSQWERLPDHGPQRPAPKMAWIKLELLYQQVAREIAPQMDGETVLAAGDVGVLGYYTPARILDTVGLNSPEALEYYPIDPQAYVINYAIPAGMVVNQQPGWLVFLEVYGRRTLLADPAFQSGYTLWEGLPTDIYGSQAMLVYRRNAP